MKPDDLRNERTDDASARGESSRHGGSRDEGSRVGGSSRGSAERDASNAFAGLNNEELKGEVERLMGDMAKVRDDLKRLRDVGNKAAEEALGTARDRLEEETNRLLGRLQGARDGAGGTGRGVMHGVEETVRERPMITILSSFGIGVLVGWMLGRE